jgi:hypothetical protein
LRYRSVVLVPAGPGLNSVPFGCVTVEDVRPDDRNECEEEAGQDGAERDECAEGVFLAEGQLKRC